MGTELKSINDFLFQSQVDNINLFKVKNLSKLGLLKAIEGDDNGAQLWRTCLSGLRP